MNMLFIHPTLVLLAGALLLPFTRGPLRRVCLLVVPLLTLGAVLFNLGPAGSYGHFTVLDWPLVFGRVDTLASVFALIMAIMTVLATLYSLGVERTGEHVAAWFYAAASLGVIYCGDVISLFLFWEMMTFASVFLVWFRGTAAAGAAGFRYLLIHVIGSTILLTGIMLQYQETASIAFTLLDVHQPAPATWLIMLGFGLNAALVPLHSWLPDACGEASFNGSVFLCAFTTKTAVYALARGCAGMEILVPLGVIMALYGVVYAIMENDIRKVLAWSTVSQVGYMVAAVGLGTEMAINGAAAHAVVHLLYNSLLFMATGSVLYMTGKTRFTELGGLYQKMPATLFFTIIGCLSISAAPYFAAYVSRDMIVASLFAEHVNWAGWLLKLSAVGTFLYHGLRLPYYLFYGENHCDEATWKRAADPAVSMLAAMGLAAAICLVVGIWPEFLYALLPFPVHYQPFTSYHLVETLQMLGFGTLAFYLLKKYVEPVDRICLDLDWLYRKAGIWLLWLVCQPLQLIETIWGQAYHTVGLRSLMGTARFLSWFDWYGIDSVVDDLACSVRRLGDKVRVLQSGQIQVTLYIAFAFAAVLLVAFIFSQLA
ncbi:MAG: Na(+)/H(+) antiporter subunit D [Deltaproteobacteria bacterium]|nr:MAG: Na(+)/H(+) antiporter subunit D [Deltaproteobacteria bacterium]